MNKSNGKSRSIELIPCVAAALTMMVHAGHTAAAAELPAADQGLALEEITVTARRREENVQTVPIAVSVVSQQNLRDNNIQTVTDLQYVVPSLSAATNAPNEVRLNLRGQGVSGNSGQAGVVMFFNEVPIPNFAGGVGGGVTPAGPGLFFDLENVQVLKGPQGTLFGKNSVGGDILLQTARPTNEFGGHIQASYGNYNDRELDGVVNLPLVSDVLLARVAFNGQLRDGYTHVLGEPSFPNGIDGDNRNSWSVRATITFRPTDGVQNDTIFTDSKFLCRCTYGVLVAAFPNSPPSFPALLAQQQALGIRTALPVSVDNRADGSTLAVSNITRIELADNLTLKNIFGYFDLKQALAADQDTTAVPWFDFYKFPLNQELHQYTDELQLTGKSLADRLNWIVGVFYLDQPTPGVYEVGNDQIFNSTGFSLDRTGTISRAAYAQGTYDLSAWIPQVKFTAGVRYTNDQTFDSSRNGTGYCTGFPNDCGISSQVDSQARSHAITWTVGLDYQVATDTLLYVKSDRGYRPGGYNKRQVGTGAPLPGFGPEYVTEEEFGVKSDWKVANVPIRTNADIWYQDYTNIQVQELIAGSVNTLTQNAGAARLWGAELEAFAQLTEDLQVGVSYDHVHLNYTNFNPGVDAGTIDRLRVTTTFNNPPNKYGVNARYHLPLPKEVGNVSVKAIWNWQASSGDTSVPGGYGMIKAFGLLNMTADWNAIYGGPIDVSLFASNLLNKDYVTQAVPYYEPPTFGYGGEIFGEPRMYGIRVRYNFGAQAK
jgi:iron complex outermembrane receptor protein